MCSAISSYRSACSASFAKYTFCSRASTIVQNELLRTRNRKPAKAGPYNPSISTKKNICRTVSDAESSSVLHLKLYSQRCRQRYSSPAASDAANDADSLRGTRQPHSNPSATHPELSRVHLKAQPVERSLHRLGHRCPYVASTFGASSTQGKQHTLNCAPRPHKIRNMGLSRNTCRPRIHEKCTSFMVSQSCTHKKVIRKNANGRLILKTRRKFAGINVPHFSDN